MPSLVESQVSGGRGMSFKQGVVYGLLSDNHGQRKVGGIIKDMMNSELSEDDLGRRFLEKLAEVTPGEIHTGHEASVSYGKLYGEDLKQEINGLSSKRS